MAKRKVRFFILNVNIVENKKINLKKNETIFKQKRSSRRAGRYNKVSKKESTALTKLRRTSENCFYPPRKNQKRTKIRKKRAGFSF